MKLKVGTWLPNFAFADDGIDHAARLRHWILRAEELGLDSIWVTDHLLRARNMYARTWLEPLTTLAFAAALTKKVLLGPGVLLLPLRNPVLLAKEIASIQKLSNGRFVLGAGTGWFENEFEAVGTKKSERGRRTDEVLEIVRRLTAGETLTYEGKYFHLKEVNVEPSPVKIPVWVGGGSQAAHPASMEKPQLDPKVARRIANADGWFSRPASTADQIADDWRLLQPYLQAAGKDSRNFPFAHGQWVHLTEEDRHARAVEIQHAAAVKILGTSRPRELLEMEYLFGTIDEITANLQQRIQAGVDHLILHPYTDDPAQLELWASELLPRLKAMDVNQSSAPKAKKQ